MNYLVPVVSVAIPTRNRPQLLGAAIHSALAQTVREIEVVVVDNSDDNGDTRRLVSSFNDERLLYCQPAHSLDVIDCWNVCIEQAHGAYVVMLGDDDRLRPTFVERSLLAMQLSPSIGFTFTHANKTDIQWNPLQLWGYDFLPPGIATGQQYLSFTLEHACCISLASTVLVRKAVHDVVGVYVNACAHNTFDFNFYLRAAESFDTCFIDEVLVDYRLHPAQLTETHWRRPSCATGKIGTHLELLALISRLTGRSGWDGVFLRERMACIIEDLSARLRQCLPDL